MEGNQSFLKLIVRVKNKIVADGLDDETFDFSNVGTHLSAVEFNAAIERPNAVVVDMRNYYESEVGHFENAVCPDVDSFKESLLYVKEYLANNKNDKIILYCTGGIRCEKASSYMLRKGFKNLYQLKGGILQYLEKIQKNKSKWKGECFVFDNRVSVKNKLSIGTYELCFGCRMPISMEDRISEKYEKGVSCIKCFNLLSNEKKERLRERNKQIKIAKKKGIYNPYIKYTPLNFL